MSAAGIYIHVPFCLRKCPYCAFYSRIYSTEAAEGYVRAVCRNIAALAGRDITADTVYFGGGTPSLLTSEQVGRTLDTVRKSVHLTDSEITLEANPTSVTEEKLRGWLEAGVNRLSIGFQSADDEQLRFLGRLHDRAAAENAVLTAHKAGFRSISCDLILGSEGQDIGSLDRTLDRLLSLPIDHLSAYMLKIEEGTPFDSAEIRSRAADDDTLADLYERLCSRMSAAGWEHYEISNFARERSYRSRHNTKYWRLDPYIGIGPSAHSDFGGRRYYCPDDLAAFIEADLQPTETEDSSPDRAEEYVMLGLRLSEGIDLGRLTEYGGDAEAFMRRAKRFAGTGLLTLEGSRVSLTEKGFLVSNSLIAELV